MHCKLYSIYVCEFAYMISGIWAGFGFGFLFMLMLHFTIFFRFRLLLSFILGIRNSQIDKM